MVGTIMAILAVVLSYCLNWFNMIMLHTRMFGIYRAGLFVFLLYKFILAPLFGADIRSAGSDLARRNKQKGDKK